MRKVLGYGFKLSSETIEETLRNFYLGNAYSLCKNRKEVLMDIAKGKADGDIPKNAKPKIFRVVVEVIE